MYYIQDLFNYLCEQIEENLNEIADHYVLALVSSLSDIIVSEI